MQLAITLSWLASDYMYVIDVPLILETLLVGAVRVL